MSFDIYGEPLRRGFCEVHPHVAQEYPCSLCSMESERRRREKAEEARYWQEQEATYYAQMAGDAEYESWFPPAEGHEGSV